MAPRQFFWVGMDCALIDEREITKEITFGGVVWVIRSLVRVKPPGETGWENKRINAFFRRTS